MHAQEEAGRQARWRSPPLVPAGSVVYSTADL